MKAMVLRGPGQLALESVPCPVPGPGDVLLRVTHGGICGTDLSIYFGKMAPAYPRIMGHEVVAEIAESRSEGIRTGQRVLVDPALSCGDCYCCSEGRTNLCLRGGLIGRETNGGFAEFVTVPARHVFPLPDGIESQVAPLIQVLTTCVHAQRLGDVSPGQSVAVTGLGVTGQLHVQLAKARGARPVIGISRSAWKRGLAQRLGADLTLRSGASATAAVLEATDGLGVDVVVECTGKTEVMAQAVGMTRPGGTIVLFGTSTDTRSGLPFFDLYFKELKIVNSRAAKREDFQPSIDMAASGAVKLEPLVSHTMPMSDLGAAMQLLASDADQRLKIILGDN